MIFCSDYENMCDVKLTTVEDCLNVDSCAINSKIVYCPLDIVHVLFNQLEKPSYKDITLSLVSAKSDFGLSNNYPSLFVEKMKRWVKMVNIPDNLHWNPIVIPPRGDIEHCKVSDKFAITMYSYVRSTLRSFPHQIVRWYVVNNDVIYPRITMIPFGLPDWARSVDFDAFKSNPKQLKVYLNCQLNTLERAALYEALRTNPNVQCVGTERPYLDYLKEMSQYKFVLCPSGNGLDSFRIMEAIAVGSIPLLLSQTWTRAYDKFPVIRLPSFNINEEVLNNLNKLAQQLLWINEYPKSVAELLQ